MNDWKVKDTDTGDVWHKDSRAEAEEAVEEFGDMRDLEIIPPDGADGGESAASAEVVDSTDADPPAPTTEDVGANGGLPDRSLTEDPIDWLAQGSDEFVTTIKGSPVITKKGFRVLQHKYDISTTSEVVVGPEETGHEFARVKATATMPDGRSAEAHASASTDRDDDSFLLTSLADTRAKSRALSDITGVGAIAAAEYVEGFDTESSK